MIRLDGGSLTPSALHRVAVDGLPVRADEGSLLSMEQNWRSVPDGESVLESKREILVGPASAAMSPEELSRTFIHSHCAGVGELFPDHLVRAAMLARANVLLQARSGCRPRTATVLVDMLNQGVRPEVPCQGSVGAAGDLAPMAHIAQMACGYAGDMTGVEPLSPTPKEALALINGVSMSAALAAVAVVRSRRVLDCALVACAMTMEASRADPGCIDARPQDVRGHTGAILVAAELRELLVGSERVAGERHPDAFSIRCAPGVLGAVSDAIDHVEQIVEQELNGLSDNPLLFDGVWLEAGNFHGASLAMAMDHLRIALAQLATISERRTYRLTHGDLSPNLPSFLVPGTGLNSGFMLAQYTAASLASEVKGFAHPASVDSIPTIQHHEDHNSMAPIAARLALRSIECVADIVGIEVLLGAQALDLCESGLEWQENGRMERIEPTPLAPKIREVRDRVRAVVPFWEDDGVLHPALESVGRMIRRGEVLGELSGW